MATWKEVAGYEELYLISDEGQVLALPKEVSTKNPYGGYKWKYCDLERSDDLSH